jgi:hypothetical protein
MPKRPYYTEAQIIDALSKAAGIQAVAAELLERTFGRPCSRQQMSYRIQRSERLRKALGEIEERDLDITEGHLKAAAKRAEPWAIRYYLDNKGGSRGYGRNRVEVTGKDGGPIEHRHTATEIANMTDEQLSDYLRQRTLGPS